MKVLNFILVLFVCSTTSIISQTTVGFKHPQKIAPILSYRLPKWGYSTFSFNLGSHGNNIMYKYNLQERNLKSYAYNFSFASGFESYKESENSIMKFVIHPSASYNANKNKTEFLDSSKIDRIEKQQEYTLKSRLQFNWDRYYYGDRYFIFGGEFYSSYHESQSKLTEWSSANLSRNALSDRKIIKRYYTWNSKIGIGYGRVRNVTPLIRALRLQERYATIKDNATFTDNEIQLVAQEIAKKSGYALVYDRYDKYFWNNILDKVEAISELAPFEVFYLADVLRENMGARFEGWDVSSGFLINGTKKVDTKIGVFLQGQWYKNLSLENQLSIAGYGNYAKYIDENISRKAIGNFEIGLKHLWAISDRILWETGLNSGLTIQKIAGYPSDNSMWYEDYHLSFVSSFTYYIENNLYLRFESRYLWDKYDKKLTNNYFQSRFNYTLGITYYLDRKLK